MYQLAPNVPGQPHKWGNQIAAWALGHLVQWRYNLSPEATDADWQDCDYPSRGQPNWDNPQLEFRIVPVGDASVKR